MLLPVIFDTSCRKKTRCYLCIILYTGDGYKYTMKIDKIVNNDSLMKRLYKWIFIKKKPETKMRPKIFLKRNVCWTLKISILSIIITSHDYISSSTST